MSPPAIRPMLLNQTRMNLPNLEELSFLTVLALPYASNTGLVWTTWSSREAFFFSPSFGFFPDQVDFVLTTFARVEYDTCGGADEGKVGDDLLGVLGLPGPGLASNQNGLILTL